METGSPSSSWTTSRCRASSKCSRFPSRARSASSYALRRRRKCFPGSPASKHDGAISFPGSSSRLSTLQHPSPEGFQLRLAHRQPSREASRSRRPWRRASPEARTSLRTRRSPSREGGVDLGGCTFLPGKACRPVRRGDRLPGKALQWLHPRASLPGKAVSTADSTGRSSAAPTAPTPPTPPTNGGSPLTAPVGDPDSPPFTS